jgi:hypothetical protein
MYQELLDLLTECQNGEWERARNLARRVFPQHIEAFAARFRPVRPSPSCKNVVFDFDGFTFYGRREDAEWARRQRRRRR